MSYDLRFTQVMDADTRVTVTYREGLPPMAVVEHFDGEEEAFVGWDRWDEFDKKHFLWNHQRPSSTLEERRLDTILSAVTEIAAENNRAEAKR